MTATQEEYTVYAMVAALILVAVIGALCRYAPYGEQSDDRGFFYVKPLGGDHE